MMEIRELPPLNWLRSFEATARHLSFTAAAGELMITQSAVSQQVKLLEHFLGQPLFLRRPRRLQMTDVARNYLPTVINAFRILRDGTGEFLAPREESVLEIKANTAFSVFWLLPNLSKFTNAHPDVRIHLSTAFWSSDFAGSNAGIEIRYGRGEWDDVSGTRLRQEMIYPVCAPEIAERLHSPEDLLNETRLHLINLADNWAFWEKSVGLPNRIGTDGHYFNTLVLALDLAKRGQGITLGHDTLCADFLANEDLVKPFDLLAEARDNYYAVLPHGERSSPEARLFHDWVISQFLGA